ncbi:MAG: hypothetical protein A2X77_05435 [Gammaproteobacteria bacterium GWE2_42_36]|nr:MAG: hypothetical protein A2X77_05435 [Gammaproteobacteria bacterium GWE2_42_36]HCU05126.1 hypothetical protein [Coxiellaceae bacterium]
MFQKHAEQPYRTIKQWKRIMITHHMEIPCYKKAYFVRAEDKKQIFLQSTCALPISVGQAYHEGEKFLSTVYLINKNFKQCIIFVADLLQRFTLQIVSPQLTEAQTYQLSIQNGQEWIDRNQHYLNTMTIPFRVIFWSQLLEQPEFDSPKKRVDHLYEHNESFKNTLDAVAETYIKRQANTIRSNEESSRMKQLVLDYIKEECAIESLRNKEGFDYTIYPSQTPLSFLIALYENLLPDQTNVADRFITIRFKQRKGPFYIDANNA